MDKGNYYAYYCMGKCYEKGHGVTQSWEKILELFNISAENGCDVVQSHLGFSYKDGEGVEKNIDKAIFWIAKSRRTRRIFSYIRT